MIKPLYDRIVVQRNDAEEVTTTGIILTGSAVEKPSEGTVLAVGCGKLMDDGSINPPQVSVGNKIIFSKNAGTDVVIEGVTYLIMHEAEVMGVLI
jgi:chaperonin GroES